MRNRWKPRSPATVRLTTPPPVGRAGLLAGLLLAGLAAPAAAADLVGRVELTTHGGKRPARGEDPRQAVVWFEPLRPAAAAPPAAGLEVVTQGKEFVPRVLVVPVGSTVRFPNRDPILHNVFSVAQGNAFDLGLAGEGEGGTTTFRKPGVVRVFCNVHHSMVAYLLVLAAPFHTTPGEDGRFALRGVPSGPGRLTVWHERSEPRTVEVRVPAETPLELDLEISKPRIPPHLDKLGRRYGRSRGRY